MNEKHNKKVCIHFNIIDIIDFKNIYTTHNKLFNLLLYILVIYNEQLSEKKMNEYSNGKENNKHSIS